VRVNGLGTDWHDDDLAAVAGSTADGVLVPKVEGGEQVRALATVLDTLDAPTSLRLWVMIETPRAILRVEEIASASDRLAGLVVGTNDLVNDLHGLHVPGRAPVLPALALAMLGARQPERPSWMGYSTTSLTKPAFAPRLDRAARWASTVRP